MCKTVPLSAVSRCHLFSNDAMSKNWEDHIHLGTHSWETIYPAFAATSMQCVGLFC